MEAPGSILQVACWGNGDQGRLGLGSDKSSAVPRLLGALKDACFTGVSSGGAHTAAVAVDGTAFLWGLNDRGQLAQGTESPFLQVQSSHHVPHMHDDLSSRAVAVPGSSATFDGGCGKTLHCLQYASSLIHADKTLCIHRIHRKHWFRRPSHRYATRLSLVCK